MMKKKRMRERERRGGKPEAPPCPYILLPPSFASLSPSLSVSLSLSNVHTCASLCVHERAAFSCAHIFNFNCYVCVNVHSLWVSNSLGRIPH